MSFRQRPIAVGDRFARTSAPDHVFQILRIEQQPNLPAHARLVAEGRDREQITIGVSALADPKLFRRVAS